jgi:hypothetical protein
MKDKKRPMAEANVGRMIKEGGNYQTVCGVTLSTAKP